ncbi:hypothetical protein DE146DRAFT_738494 [Phaeosphaeria sp. MPI-PUGE-AT-0046c]|nr:hypothetical protein DE146DRAFT_738494 [Phaeosphaeria sp. MPI-PUGE-AT-0046c]
MVDLQDRTPDGNSPSHSTSKSPSRFPKFRRWRTKSSSSSETQDSSPEIAHTSPPRQQPHRLLSITEVPASLSNDLIKSDYTDLYHSVVDHVHRYYLTIPCHQDGLRAKIASTTAGAHVHTREMIHIISDIKTRAGGLTLCISWVILSRCLLLKSGVSNSPGSTFLPPEIVECFQSFSFGHVVGGVRVQNHAHVNWALLSRWKQITAALMHATYVSNGFSYIDSRTANVERALKDLEPLLSLYAIPGSQGRLTDLRFILQKGARLAFTLYGEPCVWQFYWGEDDFDTSDRAEIDPLIKAAREQPLGKDVRRRSVGSNASGANIDLSKVVIWPALLRVVDGAGNLVGEEERVLSAHVYMKQCARITV